MIRIISIVLYTIILSGVLSASLFAQNYLWLEESDSLNSIEYRIEPPPGFVRVAVDAGGFAAWLRGLPLKPEGARVLLFDGQPKRNQAAGAAVVDIDIGGRDLQQCADAVIRLRAEYLFAKGLYDRISFNFTSGDTAAYVRWRDGFRPRVRGGVVTWKKTARSDSSYWNFRVYLETVFTFAGSYSLERQLTPVEKISDIESGDVFIRGGFPGHAVIVVDVALNKTTGEKVFLLTQSYMPAQDIHVLTNPTAPVLSPWYDINFGDTLYTPEWIFLKSELRRFR
ncbi:MAG: DUF4846 domain-containing protein [candidate division Zixibacteria bacterium]|nr:DUF4846 domain-containing protein [candidate division Zixibacteria bacterium]